MAVSKKVKSGTDGSATKKAKPSKTKKPTTAKPAAKKGGSGTLVVVESPAKAATIKKYLGAGYVVKASVGHVKDLPKASMGIDVEHDFQPEYVVIEGKKKVIADIKAAAKRAEKVLLAPDPDREGEAIAWHIAEEIRPANPNIQRVLFNEITKKAVNDAILHPLELDMHKFESQQARRVLDRLVGYEISPVLWSKVRRGLSAGRVQSVAVRLVVDREAEIKAFRPEEYWTIEAQVEGSAPPPFAARVVRLDGEKAVLSHEGQASEVVSLLSQATLRVTAVERKERRKNPPAPFITSRLQQEASSKLRFSPKRTMGLAQRLYEGVELGDEGPTGLITYMRTDSTRLSEDAVKDVRAWIVHRYGAASAPPNPTSSRVRSRPRTRTRLSGPPRCNTIQRRCGACWPRLRVRPGCARNRGSGQTLHPHLESLCGLPDDARGVRPDCHRDSRGPGRPAGHGPGHALPRLPCHLRRGGGGASPDEETDGSLPDVHQDEILRLLGCQPEQHFTQPPPRYSEATLVRELEEKGIGRPSTYATILSTIQDRGYVEKKEGRLGPTELGVVVNGLLVKSFPEIVSSDFTAQMEEQLDEVEEGAVDWVKLLRDFYGPFEKDLARAKVEMRDLKREEEPTEEVCEKCGKPMVIKWGRNGYFLACSGYPDCRNTKEYTRNADGTLTVQPTTRPSDQICPSCGSPMVIRRGRFGEFLACSRYPDCKTTSPISLGVACPRPGCGGYLTEKRSRRGKIFFGCSNYSKTKCDFVSWDRPLPQRCPQCDAAFVVQKVSRAGVRLRCLAEGCGWTIEPDADADGSAAPDAKAS